MEAIKWLKMEKATFSPDLAVCHGAELSDGHILLLEGEPSSTPTLLSLQGQGCIPCFASDTGAALAGVEVPDTGEFTPAPIAKPLWVTSAQQGGEVGPRRTQPLFYSSRALLSQQTLP